MRLNSARPVSWSAQGGRASICNRQTKPVSLLGPCAAAGGRSGLDASLQLMIIDRLGSPPTNGCLKTLTEALRVLADDGRVVLIDTNPELARD